MYVCGSLRRGDVKTKKLRCGSSLAQALCKEFRDYKKCGGFGRGRGLFCDSDWTTGDEDEERHEDQWPSSRSVSAAHRVR